jgi:Na+-transporting methylmalonyl-CoA/oxaloacetate decarboxylase gamma subunit
VIRFALLVLTLLLASVACMEPVATPTISAPSASTPTPAATAAASATASPTEAAEADTAQVIAAALYVRQLPDAGSAKVGELYVGQRVTVISCADEWCQIERPFGYVYQGCLSIESDLGCEAKGE